MPPWARPLRPLQHSQYDVQPRVVSGTTAERPRIRIFGVYVVAANESRARPGGRAEQELNSAVIAREGAPGAGAVDGGVCNELPPAVTLQIEAASKRETPKLSLAVEGDTLRFPSLT